MAPIWNFQTVSLGTWVTRALADAVDALKWHHALVGNGINEGACVSYSNLIRLGGLAPIAGGVVFAGYASLVGLSEEALFGGALRVLFILFLLSWLAGIVALHFLLQRERPRDDLARAIVIVSAIAFVGVALMAGGYIIGLDGLVLALFFLGVSAATFGIIGLALATFSVGVLP